MRVSEWNACTCPWILAQFVVSVSLYWFPYVIDNLLSVHCNLYNERKMIIFSSLFLTKENTPRYGHSKKFRWLFCFSNANVFLVFSIKHVHVYNYEQLIIIICLLEMVLVVHVEIFTHIRKLNWHTSTIVMVIVLQRIQSI